VKAQHSANWLKVELVRPWKSEKRACEKPKKCAQAAEGVFAPSSITEISHNWSTQANLGGITAHFQLDQFEKKLKGISAIIRDEIQIDQRGDGCVFMS